MPRRFHRTVLYVAWSYCWVLFYCHPVHSQYRFDHWTADNGLPQNSVRDILQTRDGYLWLATFDGLVRFDGVRFTVFNKSNSPGIINNRLNWLYEDNAGDLWIGTEASGIIRLQTGQFTTYTTAHGLPHNTISAMGGDEQGELVLLFSDQAFRWDGRQFVRIHQTITAKEKTSNPTEKYSRFPCVAKPTDGVGCYVEGEFRTLLLPKTGKSNLAVVSPVRDRQGVIWLYSLDKGLTQIDANYRIKVFDERDGLLGGKSVLVYGQPPLKALTCDSRNQLWLTELEAQQSHLVAAQMPEGLRNLSDVLVTYADREGNYWFGTARNGLYRARRQSVTIYAKPQGLLGTEVYPLLEDQSGQVWLGTSAAGVFRFQNNAFQQFLIGRDQYSNTVTSLHQDRTGRLWIGGIDHVMRMTAGRLETVSTELAPVALGTYWTIYEETHGTLWLGATHGVMRYQNGVVTRFTSKDGLAGDDTKVILPDGKGGLWLGSYGGLTHYQDGQFRAWTDRDGLPSNTVRALHQDHDGALWIGTYDGGLGRFKDGRFTRFTMKEGLFDNGVFQILADDQGWFWMSCNRGIFRVQKQSLDEFADGKRNAIQSIAYGKGDGLLNVECNGGRWPAGIKTRDGKLWFPTMEGVAVIDPATINMNPQPPPVFIEDFKIDNKSVFDGGFKMQNLGLELKAGQENFEIEYTALSFINSENLRFRYKLEGLDHDWVEAGTRRTAYFSHVPSGDYTFKVVAANSDGLWNEVGQSLRITVLPPLYRTWWFLTLSALVSAGVVFTAFRYRVAQLEQRHAAQQAFARQLLASQENERQRIAAELHDSLGQNLLVIKNRALLKAMTVPEEQARAQFNEFSDAVSQTIEEVRAISHDLRPAHLDQLGLRIALIALIEKVDESSPITFTHDIAELDGMFAPGDDIHVYRIVQECINNVLKHSRASEARLQCEVHDHVFTLTIHDNGQGLAFNADAPGLGLQSIAERVRILGGTHTIQSASEQGATITVRIDLKDKQS